MQLAGAQPFQRLLRNARPSALVDYPQVTTLAVIRVGSPWTTSRHPLRNLIQPNESIGSGYALQLRSRIVGCASASIRARRVAFQELAEGFAIACGRHATTSPNLRGVSAAGSELRMRIRVSPSRAAAHTVRPNAAEKYSNAQSAATRQSAGCARLVRTVHYSSVLPSPLTPHPSPVVPASATPSGVGGAVLDGVSKAAEFCPSTSSGRTLQVQDRL